MTKKQASQGGQTLNAHCKPSACYRSSSKTSRCSADKRAAADCPVTSTSDEHMSGYSEPATITMDGNTARVTVTSLPFITRYALYLLSIFTPELQRPMAYHNIDAMRRDDYISVQLPRLQDVESAFVRRRRCCSLPLSLPLNPPHLPVSPCPFPSSPDPQ